MRLDPAGREYLTWPVTNPDSAALEVSTDRVTWLPTTVVGDSVRILAAGPDATGNEAGTLVLVRGRNYLTFRAVDNPEIVIRGGGVVDVQ